MTRKIQFEGIENFRDFGGYDTACGRGLKSGVLFRSAHHAKATDADLARLRDLGVSVILDLRRPREREREPSRRPDPFSGLVIENHAEGTYLDWAEALKHADPLDANWFYQDSMSYYRNCPFEPRHIDLYRRWFQALAQAEGALLVHCAAGKDRTGMLCAFTHHIAGVHRDDTLADYLATNDEERIARRAEHLGPFIHELTGRTLDFPALRQAMSVEEAYLATGLAAIDERHGSLDAYLEQVLGVDAALRERIEARILG